MSGTDNTPKARPDSRDAAKLKAATTATVEAENSIQKAAEINALADVLPQGSKISVDYYGNAVGQGVPDANGGTKTVYASSAGIEVDYVDAKGHKSSGLVRHPYTNERVEHPLNKSDFDKDGWISKGSPQLIGEAKQIDIAIKAQEQKAGVDPNFSSNHISNVGKDNKEKIPIKVKTTFTP